ncbi:MAG: 30S ribosomal protein S7 [Phycisphaerales bacterium]|nr:30S ribosomal protein S7 [Phycisphaerales bacterium]
MAGRITKADEQLRPDPRYGNRVLSRFINCIMTDGRKTSAERVVYDAMDMIDKRLKAEGHPEGCESAVDVFDRAINNVKPHVEVRSKRIGGANYQVPMQVGPKRRQSLAFRWIIGACRSEKGRPMHEKLANELFAASKGEGKAMGTREQTHRMADANRAFAHFA